MAQPQGLDMRVKILLALAVLFLSSLFVIELIGRVQP
jgi:hypothetical protein